MMDRTLERAGPNYARGYRDGEAGKRRNPPAVAGPCFASHDYEEGYKAGANDAHWRAVYRGDACDVATRKCGLAVRP